MVVIVFIPEVPPKVNVAVLEDTVIPEENVTFPYITETPPLQLHVPENPVKFRFLTANAALKLSAYVPAVILNEILLVSGNPAPAATLVATAPLLVKLATGVPVIVRFVVVVVVHTDPVPVSVMLPVPKASVLMFELLVLNDPVVSVLLFRSNVPFVRVTILVDPAVSAS